MLSHLIAERPDYCCQFANNVKDKVLAREVRSADNMKCLFWINCLQYMNAQIRPAWRTDHL